MNGVKIYIRDFSQEKTSLLQTTESHNALVALDVVYVFLQKFRLDLEASLYGRKTQL